MPSPRIIVLSGLSIVLVTAVALGLFAAIRPLPAPTLTTPLADLLPREISGWAVTDQPIADTEEMKKAVGELLNYDDAIFRTYSQGPVTLSVYIAYWKPGKMSPRLIATHSPDVCWVGAGWKCTARDFAYLVPSIKSLASSAQQLGPSLPLAQAGTYELKGNVQHVLFWHIHNGKIVNYATGKQPPPWAPLADLWREGLNQRGEQSFIRISSNLPAEELTHTSIFQQVVPRLEGLLATR